MDPGFFERVGRGVVSSRGKANVPEPRGDGERYVTLARAATKETKGIWTLTVKFPSTF